MILASNVLTKRSSERTGVILGWPCWLVRQELTILIIDLRMCASC